MIRTALSLLLPPKNTPAELIAALHATANEDDAKRLRAQLGLPEVTG